ncbi:MAG TPA: DUF3865 domain-containing protein [Kineosporiaceae bacterium]
MTIVATDLSPEVARARVHELAQSVYHHPALDNAFYGLWRSAELPAERVEVVARNFYAQVAPTADRIATVFLRMAADDVAARAETVENLVDELGGGVPGKVHVVLLKDFFSALLTRLHGREVRFADLDPTILPATERLIREGALLFGHEQVQVGVGALLAQEWHAYPQLVYLYEGARNYLRHFDLEEFHQHCEYFYVHIGAAEKEHKIQSLSTSAALCRTPEHLEALEHGFTRYLDLLADFWQELAVAATPDADDAVAG